MGRIKIDDELKREKLSITVSSENYLKFQELEIKNKSKLINWLLNEHFGMVQNQEGGQYEKK